MCKRGLEKENAEGAGRGALGSFSLQLPCRHSLPTGSICALVAQPEGAGPPPAQPSMSRAEAERTKLEGELGKGRAQRRLSGDRRGEVRFPIPERGPSGFWLWVQLVKSLGQ